jgi:hypothetical protein
VKSFRAAARRIVRQEYSSSSEPLRLLGAAEPRTHAIGTEHDAWHTRMASLASLGGYDGLALVATQPVRIIRAHNLADPTAITGAVASIAEELERSGTAMHVPLSIALADGRVGTSTLAAPLSSHEGVAGTLVAVRVARGFDASDASTATSLAALLALDVARCGGDAQDARTRREALALFELARIGLSRQTLEDRLQATADMLADALGHDVAQLWLLRAGGSLRLRAARPREALVLEIARPRDNATLARALSGEAFAVDDQSLRAWVRRTPRSLIVAPISADSFTAGVVVFGRWRDVPGDDDINMAALCGEFIARVLLSADHFLDGVDLALRDANDARFAHDDRLKA